MAKTQNKHGRNRAERRHAVQNNEKSAKPMGLRVAVLVLLGIMFLGFFLLPLLK